MTEKNQEEAKKVRKESGEKVEKTEKAENVEVEKERKEKLKDRAEKEEEEKEGEGEEKGKELEKVEKEEEEKDKKKVRGKKRRARKEKKGKGKNKDKSLKKEAGATARGRSMRISAKDSRDIAKVLKNKSTEKAKKILQGVVEKNIPLKYRVQSKYPVNAAKEMLRIIESAEKNANYSGLDLDRLYINSIVVNRGVRVMTPKRQRGRRLKSTHIAVNLVEK